MKNLLFIGIKYHSYTQALIEEFEKLGYKVSYFDIEPWNMGRKILHALFPEEYRKVLNRWHKKIVSYSRKQRYDLVFFLQVHQFSLENLRQLRIEQQTARFVLYNWDSVMALSKLEADYRPHLRYFDSAFTFDHSDSKALSINYLPLFCIRELQDRQVDRQIDRNVYFIGNLENIRRYRAVRAFENYCKLHRISFSIYLACRLRVFLRLLAMGVLPHGVRFREIERREFLAMLDKAAVVFDFANHEQSGFTMRVMENLCAGKKIITNNKEIMGAPFYTPDRICVFENLDFSEVKSFIETPISSPSDPLKEYYIQNFVRSLTTE